MNGTEAYRAARDSAAFAVLSGMRALEFTGPGRAKFLQGQVTCDVESLGQGKSVHGCLVTPKGRLIGEFTIYNRGDVLVLYCPEAVLEPLKSALGRTIVLADAELSEPSVPRGAIVLSGPEAAKLMERFDDLTRVDVVAVPWAGVPGGMLCSDPATVETLVDCLSGVPRLTPEDCEVLRVERGVPAWGVDMDSDCFPLEVRLDDAVSFSKGCYMGQETLAHIKNRGHLNRRLAALKIDGEAFAGDPVAFPEGDAGKLTSVVFSPRAGGTLALAMLKADAAIPGADLSVRGKRARSVEVPL
jgi:folate-binding protein YgfZ